MSMESRRAEKLDAIRSVSLEDIVMGRHTRWRRFLMKAKHAILAVSLLGLTAAAGSAAYYLASGPDDPSQLAAAPAKATSPAEPTPRTEPTPQLAALAAQPADDASAETDLARVPKPRPAEAPIVTGSIKRNELVIYGRVQRRQPAFDPCRMFNELAFALRIPRRC